MWYFKFGTQSLMLIWVQQGLEFWYLKCFTHRIVLLILEIWYSKSAMGSRNLLHCTSNARAKAYCFHQKAQVSQLLYLVRRRSIHQKTSFLTTRILNSWEFFLAKSAFLYFSTSLSPEFFHLFMQSLHFGHQNPLFSRFLSCKVCIFVFRNPSVSRMFWCISAFQSLRFLTVLWIVQSCVPWCCACFLREADYATDRWFANWSFLYSEFFRAVSLDAVLASWERLTMQLIDDILNWSIFLHAWISTFWTERRPTSELTDEIGRSICLVVRG